jgi:hypothetical protein
MLHGTSLPCSDPFPVPLLSLLTQVPSTIEIFFLSLSRHHFHNILHPVLSFYVAIPLQLSSPQPVSNSPSPPHNKQQPPTATSTPTHRSSPPLWSHLRTDFGVGHHSHHAQNNSKAVRTSNSRFPHVQTTRWRSSTRPSLHNCGSTLLL